jgi:fluoride exporter
LIGMGGALGALARAWMVRLFEQRLGWAAPWPVLLVNLLGCFLIGCLLGWLTRDVRWEPLLRPLLAVGFLGGFTTYSAFAQDSLGLLRVGNYAPALLSVGLHVGLGLLLAGLGAAWLGR